MEWNDCEKCKNFKECYPYPKSVGVAVDVIDFVFSVRQRDLCVNNDKKLFKKKT